MTASTCMTCRFWVRAWKNGREAFYGECHVRAPQIITDAGGAPRTAWPCTMHIDWCGEHEPTNIDTTAKGGA